MGGFLKTFKLVERFSLACALLSFPYFFVFRYFGFLFAGNMILFFCLAFIFPVILSKNGFEKSANTSLVIIATTVLTFYSLILGKSSGAYLVFFSIVSIPILLYQKSRFNRIFLVILIPVFAAYFLEWVDYKFLLNSVDLSVRTAKVIHAFAMFTGFSFSILSAFLFYKSRKTYENKILKSNNRLTKNYSRIQQMISKIRSQQAMEADLEKGRKLQNSVIPQTAPNLENVIISHAFDAAKTLSGDYFGYFPNMTTATVIPNPKKIHQPNDGDDDNYDDDDQKETVIVKQLGIVVADVVGKGVAASLEMFSVKTVFKLLHEHWFDPKELVTRLNQISLDSHLFSKYVPLIYVVLTQLEDGKYQLSYVNAGHEPSIIVKKSGEVIILDQGGAPVGMDGDEVYVGTKFILEPGDVVFLITDGCTDVKSSEGETIGHEELIPILIEASKKPGVDMARYVRNRLKDFQGNALQADDMTIVAIAVG